MSKPNGSQFVPDSVGYLYHAYSQEIAFLHQDYKNWYCSNLIQLWASETQMMAGKIFFDMNNTGVSGLRLCDYMPFCNYEIIEKKTICSLLKPSQFFKNQLAVGKSVVTFLDKYYIKGSGQWYQTKHFSHLFYIDAYDEVSKKFLGKTYVTNIGLSTSETNWTVNSKHAYETVEIPEEEFELGFDRMNNKPYELAIFIEVVQDRRYNFDIKKFIASLQDFIDGTNTVYGHFANDNQDTIPKVYGSDTYRVLKKYFSEKIFDQTWVDIRPLALLWEHKKMQSQRIEYLKDFGCLKNTSRHVDSFKRIEMHANKIRFSHLEYVHTKKDRNLAIIVEGLNEIKKLERSATSDLLADLIGV